MARWPDDRAALPAAATLAIVFSAVTLAGGFALAVRFMADDDGGPPPLVGVVEKERDDRVVVARGSDQADWGHLEMRASKPLRFALSEEAGAGSPPLPAGQWVATGADADEIDATEYLEFCGDGGAQSGVDVELRLVGREGPGPVFRRVGFAAVAPCL